MTYTLRFFTHSFGNEELLKEYNFNSLPYIPRKKDLISIEDESYLVKRISTDYEDESNQLFEIMMEQLDCDKEWWE